MHRHSLGIKERRRFAELYEPIAQGLMRFSWNLAQRREDAEDLLHDALARALTGFANFQNGTNFRAWMYRIIWTTHVNRRRDAPPPMSELDERTCSEGASNRALTMLDRPTHQERVEATLEAVADDIRTAVLQLPVEFRVVYLLHTVEELKQREIADVLACPMGTVASRLARAREALASTLAARAVKSRSSAPEAHA